MEKINVAELLKDCPSGMKLDCTLFENLYFDRINYSDDPFPIQCYTQNGSYRTSIRFNEYGHYTNIDNSKCVIFPEGKTTWEGFQRPFRDGDVIFVYNNESGENFHYKYIAIFKEIKRGRDLYVHGLYSYNEDIFNTHPYLCEIKTSTKIKFATEEQKEKLFDAIKANGYEWNAKTKALVELIEPKFKIGDKIKHIKTGNIYEIIKILLNCYIADYFGSDITILFNKQDEYELVPDKFDITTLKPFDRVLVRTDNKHVWTIQFFEKLNNILKDPFVCMRGERYHQCIPYEGNEHLLNTANDCDEFYKTTWR